MSNKLISLSDVDRLRKRIKGNFYFSWPGNILGIVKSRGLLIKGLAHDEVLCRPDERKHGGMFPKWWCYKCRRYVLPDRRHMLLLVSRNPS